MARHAHKDIRGWLTAAAHQGFTIRHRKAGHWQVISPDGKTSAHFSSTPGPSRRTLLNIRAELRRIGVDLP